tara:strand:+ start:1560 stop:2975 length:1416 start_codon:yes stop_codon:yes gene_type:complete
MKKKVVVLGAGVGGLSVAWMLTRTGEYEVTVLDKSPVVGGACGTFEYKNFLLDYGPHKSYSAIPEVMDELKLLMGNEFIIHEKKHTIFLFGKYLNYPIRLFDLATKMGLINLIQTIISVIESIILGLFPKRIVSYKDYLIAKFGRKIYHLVFEPLADKTWGDPSTLSMDIAETRIPATGKMDLIMRAIGLKKETELTTAKYFYYPKKGFGRIPERMAEEIVKNNGKIILNVNPTKIINSNSNLISINYNSESEEQFSINTDLIISSIPLDNLSKLIYSDNSDNRNIDTKDLEFRTAFLVYIFLDKDKVTDHHWLFFPDKDIVFGRVFEQKQMSKQMIPKDQTVICCDFTDYDYGKLSKMDDKQLIDLCIDDLIKIGLIKKNWINDTIVKRLSKFYPRYDTNYKEKIGAIYSDLKKYNNLLLTGRIGFYNYNNSDHCLDMGMFINKSLAKGTKTKDIWEDLEKRVQNYKIVD